MRIAVYEPDATGHHLAYLAHLVPALAELASEVVLVTTPATASSPQFGHHLGRHTVQFRVDTQIGDLPRRSSLGNLWSEFTRLRAAVDRLRPDHLYVPYGDRLAQMVGVRNTLGGGLAVGVESEVLLLRGGYRYRPEGRRRRLLSWLSPRLIRRGPWSRIHHLNPDDLEVLAGGDDASGRYQLMPDPVEPPPTIGHVEARRQLALPEDGRYLGCAGMIDVRKGIDLLLAAFDEAKPALRPTDRLLLAGPLDATIRSLVEGRYRDDVQSGRIVFVDRLLTPEEIGCAMAAMDVVCTPYPQHQHSASIVIRATAAHRPVLAAKIGWMERTVPRFGLGITCNVHDRGGFARAIPASLDAAAGFEVSEAARRFVQFHSVPNFTLHFTERLRERLGRPAEPSMIRWQWVLAALN